MPSRQIPATQAPVPTPYSVPVTPSDGLTPEAVFASWDGTGAGGDFLPCVSYYNADGVLLDRAFPEGLVLHAGDTAEVSYRPFRRGGGVSAEQGSWVLANYAVNATPTPAFSQDYRYNPAIPPGPVYGVGASWFHVPGFGSDFQLDTGAYLLFVTFAFGEPRIFGSVVSSPLAGGVFTLLGVTAHWTCWLVQNPNMGESVRMETHSAAAPGGATSSLLALVRLSPGDGLP